MKCLTLNTHSWMEDSPWEKLQDLTRHIVQEDYDVICLQEVNQELTASPVMPSETYCPVPASPVIREDNFAHLLVAALAAAGRTYYWSWAYNHIGYDRYQEGVAILSKSPLIAKSQLVSEVDDDRDYHTRRVLLAQTQLEGRPILLASLHLSWFGKGFEGEWQSLETALEQEKLPLILMGDFNNPSQTAGHALVLASSLNLQDSHDVAAVVVGDHTITAAIDGWEGNQKKLKVDHIFTSQGMIVRRSQVVLDGNSSPVVSDHYGLMAVIDW